MLALLRRRHAESADRHALRVNESHDVTDDPALARRVEALQHEQDAARAAGAAVRVQDLLEVVEHLALVGEQVLGGARPSLQARTATTVERREVEPLSDAQQLRELRGQ